ncbi:MAG: N-acetylmuramoyl-L-alanine amidase [Myxococcota bacterium]
MIRLVSVLCALSVAMPAAAQVVVLDPGHGGSDPGAVGCGLQEATVVLDVTQRAATLLRNAGVTVHVTRSDDRFVTLSGRSSFANARGADRFVSVHANANAGTPATGTETFVHTSASTNSRTLGGSVQEELIDTWRLRDRGLKFANFSVLRNTSMPAALAELAFINRCDPDAALLGSPSERARIAAAIARGVLTSLGRSDVIDPSPDPTPTPDPTPDPTPTPDAQGRLIGVVFEDVGVDLEDTTRRLQAASVRVPGASDVLTNDSGSFTFDLPPGEYVVTVSKDDFTANTRTCTVRANEQTWCSVGLRTAPTASTVRGVVFEDSGTGPDGALRLPGAEVRVEGTDLRVTAGAAGDFEFEVEPGELVLEVSAPGYMTVRRGCTATASETWCSIGLRPVAENGVLQGVLFVDGEVDRRVTGAEIEVVGRDERTRSDSRSGYFRLELPEGVYSFRVTQEGFLESTRTCEVRGGEEVWCSIAMVRNGEVRTDVEVVDERPPEAAAPSGAHALSGGCSAASGSSYAWTALLLLFFFGRRRRTAASAVGRSLRIAFAPVRAGCAHASPSRFDVKKPFAVRYLTGALAFALVACSGDPVAESRSALAPQTASLAMVDPSAPFLRVRASRVVAGDYVDVNLSPRGDSIALSHVSYIGLSLWHDGELRVLSSSPRSGYLPVWHTDGQAIAVRASHQTPTAAPLLAYTLAGEPTAVEVGQTLRAAGDEGAIVVTNGGREIARLGPEGDNYFEPQIDAGGRFVVFQGMSTGLYLHRLATDETIIVGAGSRARFGGDLLLFERRIEDGHNVQEVGLWATDLSDPGLRTAPIEGAEGGASPSTNGERLVFLREGGVFLGELERR